MTADIFPWSALIQKLSDDCPAFGGVSGQFSTTYCSEGSPGSSTPCICCRSSQELSLSPPLASTTHAAPLITHLTSGTIPWQEEVGEA